AVSPRYAEGSAGGVVAGLGFSEGSGNGVAVTDGGTRTKDPCARVCRTDAAGAACVRSMQTVTRRHSTTKTTGGNRVAVWRPRGMAWGPSGPWGHFRAPSIRSRYAAAPSGRGW